MTTTRVEGERQRWDREMKRGREGREREREMYEELDRVYAHQNIQRCGGGERRWKEDNTGKLFALTAVSVDVPTHRSIINPSTGAKHVGFDFRLGRGKCFGVGTFCLVAPKATGLFQQRKNG